MAPDYDCTPGDSGQKTMLISPGCAYVPGIEDDADGPFVPCLYVGIIY